MSIKLTAEQIKEIPELRKSKTPKEIALHFGVSIYSIRYWTKVLQDKGVEIGKVKAGRKPRI